MMDASQGILYVMTTAMPNVVKIGKASLGNFEKRMYALELNGYANVAGLQRRYAIVVEDYSAKEKMLHRALGGSRIGETELFTLAPDIAVHLLSSFAGKEYYPENKAGYSIPEEKRSIGKNVAIMKKTFRKETKASEADRAVSSASARNSFSSQATGPESVNPPSGHKHYVSDQKQIKYDENLVRKVISRMLVDGEIKKALPEDNLFYPDTTVVEKWIQSTSIGEDYLLATAATDVYDAFLRWAEVNGIGTPPGRQTVYKALRREFGFAKKWKQHKSDGKRYFVFSAEKVLILSWPRMQDKGYLVQTPVDQICSEFALWSSSSGKRRKLQVSRGMLLKTICNRYGFTIETDGRNGNGEEYLVLKK